MTLIQGGGKISFTQFTSPSVLPPRATWADVIFGQVSGCPGTQLLWVMKWHIREPTYPLNPSWKPYSNNANDIHRGKKSQLNFMLCFWFPKVLSLRVITWKLNCGWNRMKGSAHYRHFRVCALLCVCTRMHNIGGRWQGMRILGEWSLRIRLDRCTDAECWER